MEKYNKCHQKEYNKNFRLDEQNWQQQKKKKKQNFFFVQCLIFNCFQLVLTLSDHQEKPFYEMFFASLKENLRTEMSQKAMSINLVAYTLGTTEIPLTYKTVTLWYNWTYVTSNSSCIWQIYLIRYDDSLNQCTSIETFLRLVNLYLLYRNFFVWIYCYVGILLFRIEFSSHVI